MKEIIRLDRVSKSYKKANVINNISFFVNEGQFLVLLGPSGCGKSTILNIIAGLVSDYTGSVFIDNDNVDNVSPKDRNIGFVFQNYALYPNLTVYGNMAFSLKFKSKDAPEFSEILKINPNFNKKQLIDLRVKQVAKLLEINDILSKKPHELSGGQSQRVAIGRALVRKPKIFLFDEPLSNLDAKLRRILRDEIKKIHQLLKTTVIYVTHDQEEALTLADEIIVINDGKVQQKGSPKEVYFKPKNKFVARFVGNPPMNVINIDECLINQLFTDNTNHNFIEKIKKHKAFGVRPEHIKLEKDVMFNIKLKITIKYFEFVGDKNIVNAKIYKTENKIKFFNNLSEENYKQEIKYIYLDIKNCIFFK